jgi:pimeloyl-ACP methyl ester carboxylesterase
MNRTRTVDVPGATLHYETAGSGPVLLLIPGGPEDAAKFAGVRGRLAEDHTVVTYDPRGMSRSTVDGAPGDITVETFADDAHRLLAEVGSEPAYVFGESGGAVVGLELLTRHSAQVRHLIAHEPPCVRLLDDPEPQLAALRAVPEILRRDGLGPAMAAFLTTAGFAEEVAEEPGPADEATPPPHVQRNVALWLGHTLLPTVDRYTPDIDRLRSRPMTVSVGADSEGQITHRTTTALAARLGIRPAVLPGGHFGMDTHPDAFAEAVARILLSYRPPARTSSAPRRPARSRR